MSKAERSQGGMSVELAEQARCRVAAESLFRLRQLLQPIDDVEIGQQTRVGVNVVFRIARDPEDAQA